MTTAVPWSKFDIDVTSFDVTHWPLSVEKVLNDTENPHHRAILVNFLHHLTLEISGRWEEILEPELTVAHPVYRMCGKGQTTVLDGMAEVAGFYRSVVETGMNVMGSIVEDLYVSDTGVASESLWGHIIPGSTLTEDEVPDLDPNAHYLVVSRLAYVFRYDENAKLLGEFTYDDVASYTYRRLEPHEVITTEQARERLAPVLARVEALASGGDPA